MLLERSAYTGMWKYRVCMRGEMGFVKHNIIQRKKKSTPRYIYSRKKGLSGFLSVIKTQFVLPLLPTEWILYVYVPCSPNLWGLGLQYIRKK